MGNEIEQLRAQIAEVDRALLAGVNDRVTLVAALRAEKAAKGLPFLDPEQERRVIDALIQANSGPLSDEGVRELVDSVLALTKRELARPQD